LYDDQQQTRVSISASGEWEMDGMEMQVGDEGGEFRVASIEDGKAVEVSKCDLIALR